jgi:AraC-like DNA-binding protein
MDLQQIVLVIISGLGIFHGIFIAILLWTHKKFSNYPSRILGVLMILLSLRIGKSVVLEFTNNLELIYIYLGLCLLIFIGPLFFLYCKAIIHQQSSIQPKDLLHFLPGVFSILLGIVIWEQPVTNISVTVALIIFLILYSHLLIYLLKSKFQLINRTQNLPKSQKAKEWLNLLFYGLILIWGIYVLNLFEEKIPYIIGPVFYSLIVYSITYLAISKKYLQVISGLKYKTTGTDDKEDEHLFSLIENVIKEEKLFLKPDISLGMLSKILKVSPQKISLIINSKLGYNFNEYINRQRINQSLEIIKNPKSNSLTIASISIDSGFNSLSSFNTSFKKFVGKTPSAYRNIHNP